MNLFRKEQDLSDLFQARMSALQAVPKKLHGNLFQSDLPDWLVVSPAGITLVELKLLGAQDPSLLTLHAALRPGQRKFMFDARFSHNVAVLAATPHGLVFLIPAHAVPSPLNPPTKATKLDRFLTTIEEACARVYLADFRSK